MSNQTVQFPRLKNSSLGFRPGSLFHFFIWMIIDTLLMLLVTTTMVVMVNTVAGLSEWVKKYSWLTVLLILIGALPVLVLALLKLLGYHRDIDHFLIVFSFVLCSMGFATRLTNADCVLALAAIGSTVALTAVVVLLALYFKQIDFRITITLFSLLYAFVLIGIILFIIEFTTNGAEEKVKQKALKISVGICFIVAMVLAIFLTVNRLRLCIAFKDVYCTIIFRAFCLWLEMIIMFTAMYAPFYDPKRAL
uniref:Uncharacterized protein n=1 Tax=Trichobilharzia regenti TaxID=157069 RepID=A0AA85J3U7_TRIRE|nr:unnamed protein product [Trichobilharzia regenti]